RAHKYSVADRRLVFVDAIVIAGDRPSTHVDSIANNSIAQIIEVVRLGAFAQSHLFRLYEISHMGTLADAAFRTEMSIRTKNCMILNFSAVEYAAIPY